MPLRGHGDEKNTANIWQEVKLISGFNEDVKSYLNSSGLAFLIPGSPDPDAISLGIESRDFLFNPGIPVSRLIAYIIPGFGVLNIYGVWKFMLLIYQIVELMFIMSCFIDLLLIVMSNPE